MRWSYYFQRQKILKVFVETYEGADGQVSIIAITHDFVIYIDPLTGDARSHFKHELDAEAHQFMLIKSGAET